jgi:hypothetical protein
MAGGRVIPLIQCHPITSDNLGPTWESRKQRRREKI